MSTFSPNLNIEEVARNGDVGTWDTPTNSNWTLMDSALGNVVTIPLNNSNVVLSAAQFQSKTLIFGSTLTGSVTVTFPSTFFKSYEIFNTCTGSSAFTITLATTIGVLAVCAPPGEIVDILNDGNLYYKNFGRIGEYWDYAGSSVPNWVSGCTVPPYLNCTGASFSSGTYPFLATILGGTTLPDARGSARIALDQSAGRVSSAGSGVAGGNLFANGGNQLLQSHSHTLTDPGHAHTGTVIAAGSYYTAGAQVGSECAPGVNNGSPNNVSLSINANVTGITMATAGSGGSQNMPPVLVSGLMLIRAG